MKPAVNASPNSVTPIVGLDHTKILEITQKSSKIFSTSSRTTTNTCLLLDTFEKDNREGNRRNGHEVSGVKARAAYYVASVEVSSSS